jgi:hypothetical protein
MHLRRAEISSETPDTSAVGIDRASSAASLRECDRLRYCMVPVNRAATVRSRSMINWTTARRIARERVESTTRNFGCDDFLDTMLRSTYTTANAPTGIQRYFSRASIPLVGTRVARAGRRVRGSDPRRRNARPDPARARLLRVGANRHSEVSRPSTSPPACGGIANALRARLLPCLVLSGTWANSSVG